MHALSCATGSRIEAIEGVPRGQLYRLLCCLRLFRFRDHEFGYGDGGRRADQRGHEEMSGNIRVNRPEHGRVDGHHGAGDGGHAADHQAQQFAFGEAGDIGADQERGFGHAEKNIAGHADALGRADAHGTSA